MEEGGVRGIRNALDPDTKLKVYASELRYQNHEGTERRLNSNQPWLAYVRDYAHRHGMNMREAFKAAGPSYRKSKPLKRNQLKRHHFYTKEALKIIRKHGTSPQPNTYIMKPRKPYSNRSLRHYAHKPERVPKRKLDQNFDWLDDINNLSSSSDIEQQQPVQNDSISINKTKKKRLIKNSNLVRHYAPKSERAPKRRFEPPEEEISIPAEYKFYAEEPTIEADYRENYSKQKITKKPKTKQRDLMPKKSIKGLKTLADIFEEANKLPKKQKATVPSLETSNFLKKSEIPKIEGRHKDSKFVFVFDLTQALVRGTYYEDFGALTELSQLALLFPTASDDFIDQAQALINNKKILHLWKHRVFPKQVHHAWYGFTLGAGSCGYFLAYQLYKQGEYDNFYRRFIEPNSEVELENAPRRIIDYNYAVDISKKQHETNNLFPAEVRWSNMQTRNHFVATMEKIMPNRQPQERNPTIVELLRNFDHIKKIWHGSSYSINDAEKWMPLDGFKYLRLDIPYQMFSDKTECVYQPPMGCNRLRYLGPGLRTPQNVSGFYSFNDLKQLYETPNMVLLEDEHYWFSPPMKKEYVRDQLINSYRNLLVNFHEFIHRRNSILPVNYIGNTIDIDD
jgi:hypothetical protein